MSDTIYNLYSRLSLYLIALRSSYLQSICYNLIKMTQQEIKFRIDKQKNNFLTSCSRQQRKNLIQYRTVNKHLWTKK